MNLLASTENNRYYLFDNIRRSVNDSGELDGTPVDALGSVDGRTAFVAFRDSPTVAFVDRVHSRYGQRRRRIRDRPIE